MQCKEQQLTFLPTKVHSKTAGSYKAVSVVLNQFDLSSHITCEQCVQRAKVYLMTPEKKTIPSETSQKTLKSFISPLVVQLCLTLCDPMDSRTPTSFVLHYKSLLRFMFIESVMLSNHLILCPHFSVSLQSFPASGSFQMSWLFPSGSQSIGASASVLPMNIQD